MNITWAIDLLKDGKKVSRLAWARHGYISHKAGKPAVGNHDHMTFGDRYWCVGPGSDLILERSWSYTNTPRVNMSDLTAEDWEEWHEPESGK